MNVDQILSTFNAHQVAYLLIGGMNFLLRHAPVLTFDVDVWIEDTLENLDCCEKALAELQAEWGPSDDDWGLVAKRPPGWLRSQEIFCLMAPAGAVDIFRAVKGLESWKECRRRAEAGKTNAGISFLGLSDEDMLQCQMALPDAERKDQRIRALNEAIRRNRHA